jgi:hypothetical protein
MTASGRTQKLARTFSNSRFRGIETAEQAHSQPAPGQERPRQLRVRLDQEPLPAEVDTHNVFREKIAAYKTVDAGRLLEID